jgi:hypothetical protein
MKHFRTGLALAATLLALALPASAFAAAAQPTTQSYTTTLSDWNYGGMAYPYAGQLKLQVSPDGIISGWYTNDNTLLPVPVIGGRNGDNLWLDIGDMGRLHVNAHLQDGKLVGTARQGLHLFDFNANPVG